MHAHAYVSSTSQPSNTHSATLNEARATVERCTALLHDIFDDEDAPQPSATPYSDSSTQAMSSATAHARDTLHALIESQRLEIAELQQRLERSKGKTERARAALRSVCSCAILRPYCIIAALSTTTCSSSCQPRVKPPPSATSTCMCVCPQRTRCWPSCSTYTASVAWQPLWTSTLRASPWSIRSHIFTHVCP